MTEVKFFSGTLFGPFSTVFNDRHFSCENCDGCVGGGFDAATSQVGAGHTLSKDCHFLVFCS